MSMAIVARSKELLLLRHQGMWWRPEWAVGPVPWGLREPAVSNAAIDIVGSAMARAACVSTLWSRDHGTAAIFDKELGLVARPPAGEPRRFRPKLGVVVRCSRMIMLDQRKTAIVVAWRPSIDALRRKGHVFDFVWQVWQDFIRRIVRVPVQLRAVSVR